MDHCCKSSVVFWLKRFSKPLPTETVSATQQEFQHKGDCIIINTYPAESSKGNKRAKDKERKNKTNMKG